MRTAFAVAIREDGLADPLKLRADESLGAAPCWPLLAERQRTPIDMGQATENTAARNTSSPRGGFAPRTHRFACKPQGTYGEMNINHRP